MTFTEFEGKENVKVTIGGQAASLLEPLYTFRSVSENPTADKSQ